MGMVSGLLSKDIQVVVVIILCLIVIMAITVFVIIFFHYATKKIIQKELAAKEIELTFQKELLKTAMMVQEERERISAELHDDIGSALSAVHLQSSFLSKQVREPEQIAVLEEIDQNVQEISNSLRELVWSLNSKNDSLDRFSAFIKEYFNKYFQFTQIKAEFKSSMILDEITLTSLTRRNLLLTIKEILHNIIKHSRADTVSMILDYQEGHLKIIIRDNGIGITEKVHFGNGIMNIKKRMDAIHAKIDFVNLDPGTEIAISMEGLIGKGEGG